MSEAFKTETIEHSGQTVRIEYFYDDTYFGAYPWADCCGDVDIRTKPASYYGQTEKKPSEVIFHTNRNTAFYYDIREAHKTARAEGWCTGCDWAKGLTKRQIAAKAVRQNVEFWRGYLNDQWYYVGAVCTVLDSEGEETDDTESCWGFETFNDYHEEAAQEMAHSLAQSVAKRKGEAWRSALHEARQRKYWASRDIQTLGA